MYVDYLTTPIGDSKIVANDKGLLSVKFVEQRDDEVSPNKHTQGCVKQLGEYFDGKRTQFNLPFANRGTAFQENVWQQLHQINYGLTASYSDIAKGMNNPKAVRAVGAANGKNPLFIIVPCHRVIGADGSLTGYAGGIERKKWLLAHEQRVAKSIASREKSDE